MLQSLPAALGVLLVGLLKAGGGGDHAVFPKRGVFVALPVQRRQHVLVKASAFFQHRLGGFHACIFKAGDLGDLVQSSQVLHIEEHVFDGGGVAHSAATSSGTATNKSASKP